MRLKKIIQVVFLLGSYGVLIACEYSDRKKINTDSGIPVSVAPVVYQEIVEWDELTARFSAPESVYLRPRVSGFIETMNFEEGSLVNAGDRLFIIDSAFHRENVRHLQAELEEVNSKVRLTKNSFDRAKSLHSSKAISKELFDNRLAEYEQSKAQKRSIIAELEIAELNLSYTRVSAPISGRISSAEVTPGNLVKAGKTVLTKIVSLNPMYAYFDANERTYLKYLKLANNGSSPSSREINLPVYLSLTNEEGYRHEGYIDFLDNQVDSATGTIRGRAVFNNDNGQFIPGLYARIKLIGSGSYEGILINEEAIGTDLNNKYVFVIDERNIAQYRSVKLGEKINGLRIVKSGLIASDIVIVNGMERVRAGSKVSPQEVAMADETTLNLLQAQQSRVDNSKQKAGAVSKNKSIINSIVGG